MKIEDMKFPIMIFRAGNVEVFKQKEYLLVCRNSDIKRGDFENAIVVDSKMESLMVDKVLRKKKLRRAYYHPDIIISIFDYIFDPSFEIELVFKDEYPNISLEQIKEKVIAAISNNPDFWSSNHDVDKLINQVKRVDTLQRLFKLIQY